MRIIKFVAFLFYRYYTTTKGFAQDIPYFATICALTLLGYIHVFQILAILRRSNFIPTNGDSTKWSNYLIMGLFMLPIFIFFRVIINKRELDTMQYDARQVKKGCTLLIVYIILSFSLLMFLAILNKGRNP